MIDGKELDNRGTAPGTPLKSPQRDDDDNLSDSNSPGREDARLLAGAKARKQQEGAAASRARRAAKRRQREATALQTPPRGVDVSIESPASSTGSQDLQTQVEFSVELFPEVETGQKVPESMPADNSPDIMQPKTWLQRLRCHHRRRRRRCCYCCCCCGRRQDDRLEETQNRSYDLAPQQERDRRTQPDATKGVTSQSDTGTERNEEEDQLVLDMTLSSSVDVASDSQQTSPQGTIGTPTTDVVANGNATLRKMPATGKDEVQRKISPIQTPLDESAQLTLSAAVNAPTTPKIDVHSDNITDHQPLPRSCALSLSQDEDAFPAKARWERAVRKAEAISAVGQGGDEETEQHWKLSPGNQELVPRDYAEECHDTDADLHPSQRRRRVIIRSLSVSDSSVDEVDLKSESNSRPVAERVVGARQTRRSDR